MDDEELMPHGQYEGTPMGEIPPDYLLWLGDQDWITSPKWREVHDYIEDNRDALEEEIEGR